MYFTRVCQQAGTGTTIFGLGAVEQIPNVIKTDEKVFIVTDKGVADAGILENLLKVIKKAAMAFEIYDDLLLEAPIENR